MDEPFVGHYRNRAERARFVVDNFADAFSDRVLDVGCGESHLKDYLDQHTGIDVAGLPDVLVDLDRGGVPFADGTFDTVLCIDVLEHIEPLVDVLGELFRVARGYVIVSLPNMYSLGWRLKFLRGQVLSKEYSLAPRNRHKWLPSLAESRLLLQACLPEGWHVAREFGYTPQAWWRRGAIHRALACAFPNLLATGYWVLFERGEK